MNAPMTKFAIMRANREKQRRMAMFGRIRSEIERAALGCQAPGFGAGIVYTNASQQFIENKRAAKRAWES